MSNVITHTIPTPNQLIAFVNPEKLACLIDPRDRVETCLTTDGWASPPVWAPDGNTLAYIHRPDAPPAPGQVILYNLNSASSSPLTMDVTEETFYQVMGKPAWSPDGRYLLIDYGTSVIRSAYVVEVATGKTVHKLEFIEQAYWSPDGKYLAMGIRQPLEKRLPNELGDAVSLAVLQVGSQKQRVILKGTYEASYFPRGWLPEGWLLYDRYDWEEGALVGTNSEWTINPDAASEPQPATDIPLALDKDALKALLPQKYREGAWGLSLSNDERWLLFYWGDWPEVGVYLLDLEEGVEPEFLTAGAAPAWQPQSTK
jgi:hypothetical protein